MLLRKDMDFVVSYSSKKSFRGEAKNNNYYSSMKGIFPIVFYFFVHINSRNMGLRFTEEERKTQVHEPQTQTKTRKFCLESLREINKKCAKVEFSRFLGCLTIWSFFPCTNLRNNSLIIYV